MWKILVPVVAFAIFFVALTVKNIISHNKGLRVFNLPEYNICYLVSTEYKIELIKNGFKYFAGKNYGTVMFGQGNLDPKLNPKKMGEFEGAYKKIRNARIVQYQIGQDMIAMETFTLVNKRSPANLIPFKKGCKKFTELHSPYEF